MSIGKITAKHRNGGWHWLQGGHAIRGRLFGGCADVLEFMKDTGFWPEKGFWKGKILFLETSEDKPSPDTVKWWLRNYGSQGILDEVSALLLAIPRGYSRDEKKKVEDKLLSVLRVEFNRKDMPFVTNMDFGHTDLRFILPLGVEAEVDPKRKRFRLLESAVR